MSIDGYVDVTVSFLLGFFFLIFLILKSLSGEKGEFIKFNKGLEFCLYL